MADRREEIFVRIEAVLKKVSGATVKRLDPTFDPETELPGLALMDGNELAHETPHGGKTSNLIDLQPTIAVFVQTAEKAGTALNALRARVMKELIYDEELAKLCSENRNGKISYVGCETESELAEAILADMIIRFQLTYILNPATL